MALIKAGGKEFAKYWNRLSLGQQDEIVKHLLDEPSESELIKWLTQNWEITEETARKLSNTGLPEGYGNLSHEALERIIPELEKEVITYDKAVVNAGFPSHSLLDQLHSTGEIFRELPYYGEALQRHVGFGTGNPEDPPEKRYGKIANPTVHIGLNELRKIINALIKRYGPPEQIIVEVTRELKLSRKRKQEIEREQARRQKENKQFLQEGCRILGLEPSHLSKAKRREIIQKLRLWSELSRDPAERCCPYTGEHISIEKLLSEEVEIEHILPFSRTLDDSLNNKTVSLRRANRKKGNKTPFEAFGKQAIAGYDYDAILERASRMPNRKSRRFAPDGYQYWLKNEKDFLARALNDTAYLSRISREYLSLICPDVTVIPGRMTAMLRGKLGLNRILGETPEKNRDDHRHHAIDATVVAITDRSLLQRLSTASAKAEKHHLDRLIDDFPPPWPNFLDHARRATHHIKVSHRPDHGYQGAMHRDTAYGFRNGNIAVCHKPSENGNKRERETHKADSLIPINSTNDPLRHGLDENGKPRAYKGYIGRSNYCMEIYKDERGKWQGDVISTFQAYQIIREFGEKDGWKRLRDPNHTQNGDPLLMRLMINDMVIINHEGKDILCRIKKMDRNKRITMVPHYLAHISDEEIKDTPPYEIRKTPGSLQKACTRFVTLSVLGDMRIHISA